jgi:hypothetical protein
MFNTLKYLFIIRIVCGSVASFLRWLFGEKSVVRWDRSSGDHLRYGMEPQYTCVENSLASRLIS